MSPANPRLLEPSMDEILASIRRIIADDQDRAAPLRRAEPLPAADPPEAHAVAHPFAYPLADEGDEPSGDTAAAYEIGEPEGVPLPTDSLPDPSPEPPEEAFGLSEPARASVLASFERLAAEAAPPLPVTLEDHVLAMLRPMVKAWLDENLPPLAERLVQAEIERISRGR